MSNWTDDNDYDYVYESDAIDEEQHTEDVAIRINVLSITLNAQSVHTGGGIYCVQCDVDDKVTAIWGMSGEFWGCDIHNLNTDEHIGGKYSNVSSDSKDVNAVAQMIVDAMKQIRAGDFVHE